jgi:iron complex outermembrane receptor protein
VKALIGDKGTNPAAFSQLTKKEIQRNYTTQDVPEYLSYMPSTTFYSENGNGIGYNYLSIRGFDQRRISVSVNGIPQNDPEDNNIYWLDMPDLLGSTGLVQVQRGAGAGVIGYPSIGGSINLILSPFSSQRSFNFSSTFGAFNTRKYKLSFSSGLIDKKYSIYVSVSNILSSGYRDKSWTNFKSYYLSAVRYDKKLTTQINLYGGPISDGLVYNGLPKWAVKDRTKRRENYSYWEDDGKNYTYVKARRSSEIENFFQPHFEMLNEYEFSKNVKFNSALFLVLGNGFFDYDGSWSIFYDDYFRLKLNGFDDAKTPGNALIRAKVENKQWGWIPRLSVKHNNGELVVGGEFRKHNSIHWGSVNYAENLPAGITKDYKYYYYEGGKDIYNFFANENYSVSSKLSLLGEIQAAYHTYKIDNEKYVGNNFSIDGLYLNPRVGLNYKINGSLNGYAAFARVTREPRLKNYYDAAESSAGEVPQFTVKSAGSYDFNDPLVKPEIMNDLEAGFSFKKENFSLTLNLFYMIFNDEIVKKGQVDRFGQPVTGNIDKTIHSGAELSGSFKMNDNLEFIFNGSYSKNSISSGGTYIKYKDPKTGNKKIEFLDLTGNRISGFPQLTANGIINFNYRSFFAQLTAKYVGDFYSDNYDDNLKSYLIKYPGFADYSDNKVDAYFTANFFASYSIKVEPYFQNMKIFVQINNLFDNLYAAYAIGKEFFPAADRNLMFGINMGF